MKIAVVNPRTGLALVVFITLIAVLCLAMMDPIAQDQAYHHFADTSGHLGIPNFFNVLSNLPFLFVGGFGLWRSSRLAEPALRGPFTVLCLGAMAVGLGSAYYHWQPSNAALVWDRLPMTVAFMALFSMLLEERLLPLARARTLLPLLLLGVGSVFYWSWTESLGRGDLRPYALVQFLPILIIPLLLIFFPARTISTRSIGLALLWYVVAKLLEHFDAQVLSALNVMSGHSLKHLAAAVAVAYLLAAPRTRD